MELALFIPGTTFLRPQSYYELYDCLDGQGIPGYGHNDIPTGPEPPTATLRPATPAPTEAIVPYEEDTDAGSEPDAGQFVFVNWFRVFHHEFSRG